MSKTSVRNSPAPPVAAPTPPAKFETAPHPVAAWLQEWGNAWERFWFIPSAPYTLALLRILAGGMLLYTHLVWTKDYTAFLGPTPWINNGTSQLLNSDSEGTLYAFSHFWWIESPTLLWLLHLVALASFACLTLGLFTRVSAVLACFFTLSYCHRLIGAQYGLDQVNAMFALYLPIGRAGDAWSVDRWLAQRRAGGTLPPPEPSASTTIAIRLLQLHLSIVYLFGGIGKMRGESWWDGSALWMAFASYEYQSFDMTWMAAYPWFIALATHATVFWETFYPLIIWPRLTRPIAILMAVIVHGGIAVAMGMKTFGLAMIFANLAFLYPNESKWFVDQLLRPFRRTGF